MQNPYDMLIGEKNRIYYQVKFDRFGHLDEAVPRTPDAAAWLNALEKGLHPGWNWPAFFFGGIWALYRKMYGWFFAWLGLAIILKLLNVVVVPELSFLVAVLAWIGFAVFADALYLDHCRRLLARAEQAVPDDPDKRAELLRYQGGVHGWVPWVFGALPVAGIVAAILIPQLARH